MHGYNAGNILFKSRMRMQSIAFQKFDMVIRSFNAIVKQTYSLKYLYTNIRR